MHYNDIIDASVSKIVDKNDLNLPFFHLCKGEAFRDIFREKKLQPSSCSKFKEDLLYFFYGLPSYRVPNQGESTSDLGLFPVVFVANLPDSMPIVRIFPFDSGAFLAGILSKVFGKEALIEDYMLTPSFDFIAKFIAFFYGGDGNYFRCECNFNPNSVSPFAFELQRLRELASLSHSEQWDNRATTLEIQTNAPVNFEKDTIEAVILPPAYMNDAKLSDFLYANDIEAITYGMHRTTPDSLTPLFIEKTEKYLRDKGLLP